MLKCCGDLKKMGCSPPSRHTLKVKRKKEKKRKRGEKGRSGRSGRRMANARAAGGGEVGGEATARAAGGGEADGGATGGREREG